MRDELAKNIKRLILGPYSGDDERITYKPLNLYSTGILYPQPTQECELNYKSTNIYNPDDEITGEKESDESDSVKVTPSGSDNSNTIEDDGADDELKLATNFSPSSLGFSFIVSNHCEFIIKISFGRYKKNTNKDVEYNWYRKHFESEFKCVISGNTLLIDNQKQEERWLVKEENFRAKMNFFIRNAKLNDDSKKLITISLINGLESNAQRNDENCIFQPKLEVVGNNPVFDFFHDNTDYKLLANDREALNNLLLYRDYKIYAMGHGVSVNWSDNRECQSTLTKHIWTEVMPEEDVYGVKFDIPGDSTILEMKRLSGPVFNSNQFGDKDLKKDLIHFVGKYKDWIDEQKRNLDRIDVEELKLQGIRNLESCTLLYSRLEEGIELIFSDINVKRAFYDANRAMFMQRIMGAFSNWRSLKKSVIPGTEDYSNMPIPEFSELPSSGRFESDEQFGFGAKWRPFQLAFLLSQIKGMVKPDSSDRDTTDLIWFPTGGGKTEAYLGLIAFTLFFRRLREDCPDNGAGVSVMMRYTLRMLNLDQFQRANLLVSACEIIRSKNENLYGKIRYSSGIWVGRSLTPNSYTDNQGGHDYGYNSNLDAYIDNVENGNSSKIFYAPFIFNCPCCGNKLVKERKDNILLGDWGFFRPFKKRDKKNPSGNYLISCTNTECHYYTDKSKVIADDVEDRCFPFYTVDEEIYKKRPSLLFGTVDKYAQIAWKRESACLFNLDIHNNNRQLFPGPELIIQDELHLIGSSLGTIYGLFEYAIDKLCSINGIRPKIVGATATVKNAREQCSRLYHRKNFIQFPPPGITADDSFYMRKNFEDEKPRKYVGFMPSGFSSSTAIIRLASILMEAPNVFEISNLELDKYYTLLVYFNSLKELGKFRTFIDDDIYAYRKFLCSKVMLKIHQNYSGRDIELSSAMSADDVTSALEKLKKDKLRTELKNDEKLVALKEKGVRSYLDWMETTNKKESMNFDLFEKLGLSYSEEYKTNKEILDGIIKDYFESHNNNPIKVATATNMIATGVDISRLNVMLVNGHPKSSSEYIQASSRVGREDAGLIFSFYSATKNRDRSHYENYKSFHQAFYKYVEPASVTPHSQPAMQKIIPSIIIALTWIIQRKSSNESFAYSSEISGFIDKIKEEIISRLGEGVKDYLDDIIVNIKEKWEALNPSERRFAGFGDYINSPLKTISDKEVLDIRADYTSLEFADHLIPKVSTMRDVEPGCNVVIKKDD